MIQTCRCFVINYLRYEVLPIFPRLPCILRSLWHHNRRLLYLLLLLLLLRHLFLLFFFLYNGVLKIVLELLVVLYVVVHRCVPLIGSAVEINKF